MTKGSNWWKWRPSGNGSHTSSRHRFYTRCRSWHNPPHLSMFETGTMRALVYDSVVDGSMGVTWGSDRLTFQLERRWVVSTMPQTPLSVSNTMQINHCFSIHCCQWRKWSAEYHLQKHHHQVCRWNQEPKKPSPNTSTQRNSKFTREGAQKENHKLLFF